MGRTFRGMTLSLGHKNTRASAVLTAVVITTACLGLGLVSNLLVSSAPTSSASLSAAEDARHSSLQEALTSEIPIVPMPAVRSQTNGIWSTLLFALTGLDLHRPETLLGWQIPGMQTYGTRLASTDPKEIKMWSHTPPVDAEPNPTMSKTVPLPPSTGSTPGINGGSSGGLSGNGGSTNTDTQGSSPSGKPMVYIYHTHNREAFLPELPGVTNPDFAYDAKVNITQVGDRLSKDLDATGVATIHTTVDYWNMGPYTNEYAYSRTTAEKVIKENPGLKLVIDVHRDSGPRNTTTPTVGGQPTAGIFFIIGQQNPHWQENDAVANQLKDVMEKMYPGLCRGVWEKNYRSFDTRYNQDLSPASILIEIGGPYNTGEELNRAADDLAQVIKTYLDQGSSTSESP